jgi:hypothetical protein
MAWIPTLHCHYPELNTEIWLAMDLALVTANKAVVAEIENGVASQIVQEKALVAHFARTLDRTASLMAERKKLCVYWTSMH